MDNNPETLKYSLGQKVCWQDENGSLHEGTVINVSFHAVEVTSGGEEYQVNFDMIVHAA
jgi:plastocyanin